MDLANSKKLLLDGDATSTKSMSTVSVPEGSSSSATLIAEKRTSSSQRLLGLDILRFVAVGLVVCRHLAVKEQSSVLGILRNGGWVGVDLFFVLSGFLVSGLLFREYQKTKEVKLGRFLLRRGWKIYPSFWVMISCTILLWDFGIWENFSRRGLLGEALFLQNYVGGFWRTTWSLAVEEHFYFFLAGLVFLLLRLNRGGSSSSPFSFVPRLFPFIVAGCLAARILHWRYQGGTDERVILYPSECRMDSLMFGVLLSYWWHFSPQERFREWSRRWRGTLLFVGILCLIPAFVWEVHEHPWISVVGVIPFWLGAGMLILSILSFSSLERIPLLKPIGKLGSYSYSAYLWHGPFATIVVERLQSSRGDALKDWRGFLISFLGTWFFGVLAASLIEIPVLKLRERYFPVQVPKLK
jgi:peptidoglycan/LPS O-acetylase OafA/YrhL